LIIEHNEDVSPDNYKYRTLEGGTDRLPKRR